MTGVEPASMWQLPFLVSQPRMALATGAMVDPATSQQNTSNCAAKPTLLKQTKLKSCQRMMFKPCHIWYYPDHEIH